MEVMEEHNPRDIAYEILTPGTQAIRVLEDLSSKA